jgi:hypothetical protein
MASRPITLADRIRDIATARVHPGVGGVGPCLTYRDLLIAHALCGVAAALAESLGARQSHLGDAARLVVDLTDATILRMALQRLREDEDLGDEPR